MWYLIVTFPDHCGLPCNAVFFCLLGRLIAQLVAHLSLHLEVCLFIGRANKALFFLILGLQIFFQNIKVGGGKKNKNKISENIFFI